jgi:hypothetical protein
MPITVLLAIDMAGFAAAETKAVSAGSRGTVRMIASKKAIHLNRCFFIIYPPYIVK